jgi:hypothetical protein
MKTRTAVLVLSFAVGLSAAMPVQSQELPPAWAFPVTPPDLRLAPDDGTLRHVPGSAATYTLTQVRDLFDAPDWHPGDYLPLPDIAPHGRTPDVQRVASVIGPMGLMVPKTRVSRAFLRLTSFSRLQTSKADQERAQCRKEYQSS